MHAAGENQTFQAKEVGPINLQIGENVLRRTIYVAPIKDQMILGIDVLRELNAVIDIKEKKPKYSHTKYTRTYQKRKMDLNNQTGPHCTWPLEQSSRVWDPGKSNPVPLKLSGKL